MTGGDRQMTSTEGQMTVNDNSENGTGKWLSLTEACQALDVSESTLRRAIKRGEYQSEIENGKRRVYVELTGIHPSFDRPDDNQLVEELRRQVEYLQGKLDERDGQVERLERDFNERVQQLTAELSDARQAADDASKRSDTIIAQMTQQIDRAQLQLEDLRNEQREKPNWWGRLFRSQGSGG
jgi:chromosome segregation ATPase